MGLFSRFVKKDKGLTLIEDKLKQAFSLISSDIKHVQKELKQVSSSHEISRQDINNISLWLGYLKNDTEKAEKNFEKIGQWISYLHDQNEKAKNILENHETDLKLLKQHVATGVATLATPKTAELGSIKHKFKDVATGVANVGNVANVASATDATQNVPKPLKNLLNLMMVVGEPVSYELLAAKTGKSKITIRVNMNRLKRRGLVEEFTTPNGSKLFAAKNSEKIKKLYNVESV
jgi:hypothetical protein